jgi:hypothetical protein
VDKNELISMLQELDGQLSAPCDLILVGGAAMILHFGASRATRDVDVLMLRGDTAELRQAVQTVAMLHNLPADWLNDGIKGFADILPQDFYHRLQLLDVATKHLHLSMFMNHVATFRPDWAQKMRYFLLEYGWEIE